MKQLLSTVEIDDLSDDVQVLASTDAARLVVSGEMKIVVVAVLKYETWAMCVCSAVVAGVDKEVEPCFVGVMGAHTGDIPVELDGASLVF